MIKTFTIGFSLCFSLLIVTNLFAQPSLKKQPQNIKNEENSDILILVRHLPDWKAKEKEALRITNKDGLHEAFGEKPVFGAVDFFGDTKAVSARYDQGRLLIVEFGTPQASIDADNRIKEKLDEDSQNPPIFYKRIGNYNVFVFEAPSSSAANILFAQIKYQKIVRWLNGDPLIRQRAEQKFIRQTSDLFIATVMVILSGLAFAVVMGIFCGIIFYNIRKRNRAATEVFTDGGGLTRLNLDNLTPDFATKKMLGD